MITGMLAAVLTASTASGAPPSTPAGVAAFARERRLMRYSFALADLNGDSRPEALVYAMDRDLCGSGGCDLYILSPTFSGYRQVTAVSITRLPIRVLPTRSHGWRDLAVFVAGGGITPGYEARLRFDGRAYPTNPTVPPALRLHGDPGRIVIGKAPPPAGR